MYMIVGNNVYDRFPELEIEEKVRLAGEDDYAFELLWKDFEGNLRLLASRKTGRYIDASSDEWSCIMLAFHEAVTKYEPSKGNFKSFVDLVVTRRLTDHLRSEYRRQEEIAVDMSGADRDPEDDTHESGVVLEFRKTLTDKSIQKERAADLRLEIDELNNRLKAYGISFSDLARTSPKAAKTRRACGQVINLMAERREMASAMKKTHVLPAKEIKKCSGVPQKILEHHRKYIIAAVEIATGDFPGLNEYIKSVRKEGEI